MGKCSYAVTFVLSIGAYVMGYAGGISVLRLRLRTGSHNSGKSTIIK